VFTQSKSTSAGFTAFSISNATYERLLTGTSTPFSYTEFEDGGALGKAVGALGGMLVNRIVMRGTLERVAAAPEPMPILIDGQRLTVSALHIKGRFRYQERSEVYDFWVLADRTHPMLLRVVNGSDVLQVVRIELPGVAEVIEQTLNAKCSIELLGIHFAFASAELDSGSAAALAPIAQALERHADWKLAIEGHTDSVGNATANSELSRRRAEAVRNALIAQHRVAAARLTATGFGARRPREPNLTLEGRARNRRVELVRPCAARNATPNA
jgi:outer membrane protein OmpA-like peptidoglycan-associated protein